MNLEKLNGWQRLWVLSSVIWLFYIIAYSANEFPIIDDTKITNYPIVSMLSHKTNVIMSKRSKVSIKLPTNPPTNPPANPPTIEDIFEERNKNIKENNIYLLPNGLSLEIPIGTSPGDMQFVIDDYTKVYNKVLFSMRIKYIMKLTIVWIISSVAAYLLGVSCNWVYRGFLKT